MERQQSSFSAAALPNSLMYAEPDPPAIEIEIKTPKPTLKASFWPTGVGGGGFRPFIRNLVQTQPSLVIVEHYISFTQRRREERGLLTR